MEKNAIWLKKYPALHSITVFPSLSRHNCYVVNHTRLETDLTLCFIKKECQSLFFFPFDGEKLSRNLQKEKKRN